MLPRILSYGALSILVLGCTVDNKRGDTGASGIDGKNGADGKDGINGLAAVVYETFDRTASCTSSGQMIFVSGDSSFYVCQDQKWTPFRIKGEPGAAGMASAVSEKVDILTPCLAPGQLIYDLSLHDFYSCQNSSWKRLSIQGEKGSNGAATVVFETFNKTTACEQNGQLIFDANQKIFFYCSAKTWQELNIRGQDGAPGKNGQTLFVETAAQLPPCSPEKQGSIYILQESGSVMACTSAAGTFDWKTLYRAPTKAGPADQSLIDDCVAATGKRRDFYNGMIGGQSSLFTGREPVYTEVCPKLAELVRDAESWTFGSNFFSSSTLIYSSILADNLTDILQYFVNVKAISFEFGVNSFAVTNLDHLPSMPQLRSLSIGHYVTLSLGMLDRFPELVSLSIPYGNFVGEEGKSPFVHIGNLTKLNDLDLTQTSLTKADLMEIARLKNLRTLRIGMTPSDLSPLAGMDSLSKLILTDNSQRTRCPFADRTRCW